MGIDLATWRARIGLNYYHMCRPLPTRWRSSGGLLYQPGVPSWGVGEVMNDTPLVLKGCMTVVALSLILQYVVHSWSMLKGGGGRSKVYCHWRGSTLQVTGILDSGGALLLGAIVVVVPLLLVIAGDVELNPGPPKREALTLKAAINALHSACCKWYSIGVQLEVPTFQLKSIEKKTNDSMDQLRDTLDCWMNSNSSLSWRDLVDALKAPSVGENQLAEEIRKKHGCPVEQSSFEESEVVQCQQEVSLTSQGNETTQKKTSFAEPAGVLTLESSNTSTARYTSKISPPPSDDFEPVRKKRLDSDTTPEGSSSSPLPSERSQRPPFGCGCGKCTFFNFIQKGCPTPIPSTSSFPYLNLSGLTHEQQQELEGRLRFESREIMMRFQELVSATIKSLITRNVPLDELVSHVMTLGAFDPVFKEPQVPLFQYCFKELKTADTIPKIFLVLKDYFSFFNYDIIEHIITVLGTEEDKANLQSYKSKFDRYAKRRIYECGPHFGPVSDTDHADVFVKVDSRYESYTVEEIKGFCNKLSETLHVSSQGVLRLCQVKKGCFQLTLQLPFFVKWDIFPLSREEERTLAAMDVIELTCLEYHFLKDELSQPEVEKHQSDPDDDSEDDSGIATSSTFTVTKSTTFTEDRLDKELKELDYELKVQCLVEAVSSHKSGSGLELHFAVAMGHLEYVRFLVEKKNYNPMQGDQSGFASFHLAAVKGYVEVFKYFVTESNCNPGCPGPFGLTPLHLASEQGHLDTVKYLVIEQQMDVLCEDEYKNTPLHRACAGGHQAVVEFLTTELQYNPIRELVRDLKNKWNNTPVHTAVGHGHLGILKFFISDQNCDPNIPGHSMGTPLHYAAECGHLHIVKYLTEKQCCNPSCLTEYKFTPLHSAAAVGHMDIVKFLTVEKHCDPMCKDSDQHTPLHMAAKNNQIEVVKFLTLEMHCDPTSRDSSNDTALHLAAVNGHLDIVRFFISNQKCDPNIPAQHGATPLHYAAEFGHLQIVKYLIDERSCSPSCLDDLKYTPLHCAAIKGHVEIAKFLTVEKHCDPMCRESNQDTPLHKAAQNGHKDMVQFLMLEMHCDQTSKNAHGSTALHLAAMKGHLDIVQFFISNQDGDPNIPGQYGRTPLHYAAEFGHLHIVKYLTDKQDCNPSCSDENKFTPLHSATKMGYMGIVKFLTVEKHCDPMCRDFAQITPLHVAARFGHIHIVKFLTLEMHCDPMCRDSGQYTPLHMAAHDGHIDIVTFFTLEMHCDLTSRNANNDTALHLAVEKGHLDIVQFFISGQNCDPNSPGGQYGSTPLHYAAECGHLHIVKYLTEERGCNPSCLNKHKFTPLHRAAMKGHMNIVKFLTVNKCCNPCSQDIFGFSVLHGAVQGGHLEVVKFLVQELKCPPDFAGPFYITPLQLATLSNHLDIAQYLKNHSVVPYMHTAIAMMKQLGLQK